MPVALSALALMPSISLEEEVPAWGQVQAPHVWGDGRIQAGCLVPPALYEPEAFPVQPGLTLQTLPVASWTPPRRRHDRQICGQQGAW